MRVENNSMTIPIAGQKSYSKKDSTTEGVSLGFAGEIPKQSRGAEICASALAPAAVAIPSVSEGISGEDYLKLYQDSAAANSAWSSSTAEHKALLAAVDYSAAEEPEVTQTAKNSSVPAMPDFSGMSDSQKLSALRKLHEQTDYSSMSKEKRTRLIDQRFESAFPMAAMRSGLFGSWNNHPANQNTLINQIFDEQDRQINEADCRRDENIDRVSYVKRVYYNGMTDQEIIAAIKEKYSGGTMVDRASILVELMDVGLDDGTAHHALNAMRESLAKQVMGKNYQPCWTGQYSQGIESMISSLAFNTSISWSGIASMTKQSALEHAINSSFDTPGGAQEYINLVNDAMDRLLKIIMSVGGTKYD